MGLRSKKKKKDKGKRGKSEKRVERKGQVSY
jgi:hypothetical protein